MLRNDQLNTLIMPSAVRPFISNYSVTESVLSGSD